MKCAKCGYDVPDNAPECPGCRIQQNAERPHVNKRVCCPVCGENDLAVSRKLYSPGCGCLGLLLLGWWGLLLGLLGMNDVELICKNCGARWKAGDPAGVKRGSGCLILFVIILIVYFLCVGK